MVDNRLDIGYPNNQFLKLPEQLLFTMTTSRDSVVKLPTPSVRGSVLRSVIQERIKQLITDQQLGSGDLLPPEGQIAVDLGVSRGSVREAIKSLESLGIVEVKHGEGVRVREFNFDATLDFLSYGLEFQPAKAAEILQVRAFLEASAIEEVVKILTDSHIAQIEDLLQRWQVKAANDEQTTQEERDFHRMLYLPLGNESLLSFIDIFWRVYHSLSLERIGRDPQPLVTVKEHQNILNALRDRNAVNAKQLMTQHFQSIKTRLELNL